MVHISQIQSGHRLAHPSDVVSRGQSVYVKVISIVGNRIGLSMKDVDQNSGRDLATHQNAQLVAADEAPEEEILPNPATRSKSGWKRLTSPERFELKQLMAAGVLDPSEMPMLEDETEIDSDYVIPENEEEVDIELLEEEPAFLKGQTRQVVKMSPIKIVKAPDGTLNRSALQGAALARERREIRQQEAIAEADSQVHDLQSAWVDPMADASSRYFAQDLRGGRLATGAGRGIKDDLPEWKKSAFNKAVTFGRITSLSIREQRQSLPIYRLRQELITAIKEVSPSPPSLIKNWN